MAAMKMVGIDIFPAIIPQATALIQRTQHQSLSTALEDPTLIADLQRLFDTVQSKPTESHQPIELAITCPFCSGTFLKSLELPPEKEPRTCRS
jgi:hypothetical protein